MKKIAIFVLTLVMLLMPVNGVAATTTTTKSSGNTKTTVEQTVKQRADGGTTTKTVTTTVTTTTSGNKKTKKTVVKTVVVEKASDGFIESEETTVETTTETTTVSSSTKKTKKTSSMYSDVTKKKVGTAAYKAIKHLKAHKAFTGVIKGKKFLPKKRFTKKQYLRILKNLYGKYAPTESNPKGYVTEKYVTSRLVKVAKNLGISITWSGTSRKVTRAETCRYIKIFADFDSAFKLH